MIEVEEIFKNLTPVESRLRKCGFKEIDGVLCNSYGICEGQFSVRVCVNGNNVKVKVFDAESGEEYFLAYTSAEGAFVGNVCRQCEDVLKRIASEAFTAENYTGQVKALVDYAKRKFHTSPEFLWQKFSEDFILRRKSSKKWYAVVMSVKGEKFGMGKGEVMVIDLRVSPDEVHNLVDGKSFFPGYHMNKKSWYTVVLDNDVPNDVLFALMDISFELADKKKAK